MQVKPLTRRACIEQMQAYQPGKPIEEVERELGVRHAIKLASNENPFGCSPRVKKAVQEAAQKIHLYPDGACYYLRHALAKRLGCHSEELIIGNGSNELLVLLGMAFLNPGDEVLTSQMSFIVYRLVAQLMAATLVEVPMRDFTYDLEAMARAITPRTKIIYIANPNNPTGSVVEKSALYRFVDRVPANCLVVLDEAYYEYVSRSVRCKAMDLVRERKNVAVLRTFSKAYGLAGLRIGYGRVSREIKETVDRVRDPFNVNNIAQAAALAALEDRVFVQKTVDLAKAERIRLTKQLKALQLKVVPSHTNFLFVQLPQGQSQETANQLMKQGLIVRPFPGPFLRITLGKVMENNKMLKALKSLLA